MKGLTKSKACFGPPAIITSFPFLAPISPPETGASMEKAFFLLHS